MAEYPLTRNALRNSKVQKVGKSVTGHESQILWRDSNVPC